MLPLLHRSRCRSGLLINPEVHAFHLNSHRDGHHLAFEVTEVIDYSGITATLACGLTLNYFAMHNLSKASQDFTQQAVKVAASIADTLIFFQVGDR